MLHPLLPLLHPGEDLTEVSVVKDGLREDRILPFRYVGRAVAKGFADVADRSFVGLRPVSMGDGSIVVSDVVASEEVGESPEALASKKRVLTRCALSSQYSSSTDRRFNTSGSPESRAQGPRSSPFGPTSRSFQGTMGRPAALVQFQRTTRGARWLHMDSKC